MNKDTTENLMQQLYEKVNTEQENFVDKLKNSTPEQVISKAYEYIMREDILMTFENDDFLESKQIKVLLKIPEVLSSCYNHWLDTDCSHMDMLRDSVSDFAKSYAKSIEPKHKKNDEPER